MPGIKIPSFPVAGLIWTVDPDLLLGIFLMILLFDPCPWGGLLWCSVFERRYDRIF